MLGFLEYHVKEFEPYPEGTGESQMVLEQERNLINTVNIRINLAHPLQKFFGGKSPEALSLASMALTRQEGMRSE